MRVSDFLNRRNERTKGTIRDRTTYRAARRNIAKIAYRDEKKFCATKVKQA